MPLKLLFIVHNNSNTNEMNMPLTLLSAKEEPIDDSTFELPKDYHSNDESSATSTNAPLIDTNEADSATNEPPAK